MKKLLQVMSWSEVREYLREKWNREPTSEEVSKYYYEGLGEYYCVQEEICLKEQN